MRTSKAMNRCSNGKGGEWVNRQRRMMTRSGLGMVELKVQLVG